jgi:hypothetical protein
MNVTDNDMAIAQKAAIAAEEMACNAIANLIEDICQTPEQKVLASAIITAAMLEKFEQGQDVMQGTADGKTFHNMVAEIRARLRPTVTHYAQQAKDGKL